MLAKLNIAKAAIAPYLVYIKVGALALCLAVSATLGYRYGASTHATGEAQKAVQIVQLAAENASLRQANAKQANAVAEANRIVEQNAKQGAANQTRAQSVGDSVGEANDKLQKQKLAALEKANQALKDAKCQELMRMKVCSAVPLP